MLVSVIGVDEEPLSPTLDAANVVAMELSAAEESGETASWLAAIVQSSDDAIIGKTLDGLITSWNRAAEQLFGYPEAEMIGQSITRIVPVDRLVEQTAIMVRLARGELIAHLKTTRVHEDGTRLAVSLSISPIRDTSGRIVGAVNVCRDMSMRNSIDRALIERTSERDKLERQAVVSAATEIAMAYRAKELAQSYADLEKVAAALQQSEAALRKAKDVAERATLVAQTATAKAEAATAAADKANRRTSQLYTELETEFVRTAEIQAQLLPHAAPDLPGYEFAGVCLPARQVGGDFFDWLAGDDAIRLSLGDVMGKGMPASLLTATVRAALRVVEDLPVSAAVEAVNRALSKDLVQTNSFITLFHAALEPETGQLTYVDAGHGMVFIQRENGEVEQLRQQSLPLGVLPNAEYPAGMTTLGPGDTLVVYSDGLPDARPELKLNPVGVAGQIRALPDAQAMLAQLVSLVSDIQTRPDDLTLVVLHRSKHVATGALAHPGTSGAGRGAITVQE